MLIELCADLVRTPSVNGLHPERAVAECAAAFAQAHGLRVELPALDPQRPNLLVRAGPPGPPALLLVAHLDTVAVGDESTWHYPPFGAMLSAGRLYGRGAIDTKAGLAAALGAMVLAEQRGIPLLLAGVPDEESGATGTLGVKYLHSLGLLAGRGAIYAYPGNTEIVLGHRGVLRLRLTATGQAMHSGSREWQAQSPGGNAVMGMAEILSAIEQLRFAEAEPNSLFAEYRTVLTPTTIQGGSGPSMVPARCEAHVDIRLVPSVPREQVEAAIQAIITRVMAARAPLAVQVEPVVFIPTTEISASEPVVQAARTATQAVLGHDPLPVVSGPANESYILNGYGIPTCIVGPDGGNAHAADEYVEVASIPALAEVYAQTAARLVV